MKNGKNFIFLSLFLIPIIIAIVFADLAGVFNYGDVSFAIVFSLYIPITIIQHAKSRMTFIVTLFLLMWMGLSYIPTGAGKVTERIGEWFYLFFLLGLIQYVWEAWRKGTS